MHTAPIPLHVLLLEDVPDDAALVVQELEMAGYAVRTEVVDTREEYLAALRPGIDVVLCDHALPQFNALQALDLLQQRGLDVPFIIVSGAIQEETAVEAMRRGAADYLLKDRLARLGPAVERALRARRHRLEKERAAAAIRASEERYRFLAEHATDVIARIAPDGTILYVSPSCTARLGYYPEELVGRSVLDFVHPDDAARVRHEIATLGEDRGSATCRVQRRDGVTVWIEANGKVVRDPGSGAVLEFVAVLRDISDRVRYEQELIKAKEVAEEADRLKSSILSNMSHEVRTPLAVILGYAELLDGASPEEVAESATAIVQSARRLLGMLNSLLDLADFEAGTREVPLHVIDVRSPVRRVVEQFQTQAAERGLTLRGTWPEPPVFAVGDEKALEQVASTLVGNALKFTEAGEVSIAVRIVDTWGEVTVSDTGVGIGEDFLPYLFTPFRQESEGHTRLFEGTGVELAIAKRLVDMMGGSMEVKSSKGAGTTFTVRLRMGPGPGSGGQPLPLTP